MQSYSNDQYFIAGILCDHAMKIILEEDPLNKKSHESHTVKAKEILTSWKIKEVFPTGVPGEFFDYYLKKIECHHDIHDCH